MRFSPGPGSSAFSRAKADSSPRRPEPQGVFRGSRLTHPVRVADAGAARATGICHLGDVPGPPGQMCGHLGGPGTADSRPSRGVRTTLLLGGDSDRESRQRPAPTTSPRFDEIPRWRGRCRLSTAVRLFEPTLEPVVRRRPRRMFATTAAVTPTTHERGASGADPYTLGALSEVGRPALEDPTNDEHPEPSSEAPCAET